MNSAGRLAARGAEGGSARFLLLGEPFHADHILWGTDTPVIGPPHWQIEAFQTFTIPEQLAARHDYPQLTLDVKNKIFGENAARIFGIDIVAAHQAIEADLLYKLRNDGNPLQAGAAPL